MEGKETENNVGNINFKSEDVKEVIDLNIEIEDIRDKVKSLIRHENDIKRSIDDIREIYDFVTKSKKCSSQFFKYTGDKEYVILGTVVIAMMAIFWIPDPGNVVMSIVTGLFGLATGRAMNDKDKN